MDRVHRETQITISGVLRKSLVNKGGSETGAPRPTFLINEHENLINMKTNPMDQTQRQRGACVAINVDLTANIM